MQVGQRGATSDTICQLRSGSMRLPTQVGGNEGQTLARKPRE